MAEAQSRGVKTRNIVLVIGVALAIFLPIWVVVAALGTKFGLWPWTIGLVRMIGGIGVPLIGVLILVTFIASLLVIFIKPRSGYAALGFMWIVAVGAAGIALSTIGKARTVPPIHDISTNPANPLTFSAKVMAARGPSANPIVSPQKATVPFDKKRLGPWTGRSLEQIQADAYPGVQTLKLPTLPPKEAFAEAEKAMTEKGWTIVTSDPASGRLEAEVESLWFGFKDDVVLMVAADGQGSAIDMRSVSRVGISDLGANAARIEDLLSALKKAVTAR
ncbi:hypothetical protein PbB2_02565 [Candidatus Phycosocius bacilliformis]|uniref:DUF1499 domain-containing protein n=1 Tax=Candidatus Phycosocius bacilliformis TaxID=1445552 RepID=A0A2P2ECU1_9PROT|nr:DUF1499 domain-containing protein [Candidatus Phycosocius bacilliformis]GBF58876.1 hypothetical protein PbB2_02565 [Candidatus Phycosocius bacilliformis]